MIAVDTNILVYAHRREFPQHGAALKVLRDLAEGGDVWAVPVFVLGEFLRIVTHPRILHPPSTTAEALGALDGLLASDSLRLLAPGEGYWELLRESIEQSGARGNLVPDAQIVATCRGQGVNEILTEDRDFSRFPGVRVRRLS